MAVPIQYKHKVEHEIAERRREVLSLYARRVPTSEIARIVNVSVPTVRRDIKAIEAQWIEDAKADMDIIKARELGELEEMERAAALKQDNPQWFDRRLRTKERKARMLGLDTAKVEMTGKDGGPIDFTDARSALLAALIGIEDPGGEGESDRGAPG